MSAQPPPVPDPPEEDALSTDHDDVFVLEDHLPALEEDVPPNVWARLPTPAALHPTALTDVVIVLAIVALVSGLVLTTRNLFSAAPYSSLVISTSLSVLPAYAAQSLVRMVVAYAFSLLFSLGYAYLAYRVRFAAKLLILLIDVLQSIPLLSFLPGVVLGLIALFPDARIGLELAAVLLLFTSMAWNMLLAFYQALRCIPTDLVDVAKTFRLSAWNRFWTLELPAGAGPLVWNSVISVAGGWFFLISIESFELGNRDFKLPGLGSFLAVAAETADYPAIVAGLVVVVAIIVLIDFLIWRPLIAWSSKFNYGSAQSDDNRSIVLSMLQRSPFVRSVHAKLVAPAWERFVNLRFPTPREIRPYTNGNGPALLSELQHSSSPQSVNTLDSLSLFQSLFGAISQTVVSVRSSLASFLPTLLTISAFVAVAYGAWQSAPLVEAISSQQWLTLATSALATFARVVAALALSLLWTVPAGVAIGRNPRLAAKVQPIVQIAASVPATALFPFMLLFLARLGGGLQVGSVALMMLGTMWYVLFNVIAGAQAIPAELFEVDSIYNKDGQWTRWRTLILPGIFPYLITGVVTAVGGAWNASIVSEYVVFQGGVMKTHGLGSLISEAAATGNYGLLLAGTVVMSLLVLLTNRFVWGPLYKLAETKYRI